MTILPFVLAGASYLDPQHEHTVIAEAVARVVEADRPLFADDESRERTASLVLAVAFREGSLGTHVEGDFRRGKPTSWCTMQIHASSGGTPALNDDPVACIRKGLSMLRTSLRVCPSAPVAWYAEGPRGCSSTRARRISRDRMALAHRVHATAAAALAKEDGS